MSTNQPFHRLLAFFATRSPHPNTSTITFTDSLRGDLSLGLNFPLALILATIRHLIFGNTGPLRLHISVPSVRTSRTLLGGPGAFDINADKKYGPRELVAEAGKGEKGGWIPRLDALGFWMLAADRQGWVSGREVMEFQEGSVEGVVRRRATGRGEDVLPFWRGGPVWVGGHSWAVGRLLGVRVYS